MAHVRLNDPEDRREEALLSPFLFDIAAGVRYLCFVIEGRRLARFCRCQPGEVEP